jgi:anti-anti-sigma factor
MEITVQEMERCHLVTVEGRIESNDGRDLEKALLAIIGKGGLRILPIEPTEEELAAHKQARAKCFNIVINMKGVRFVSAAAIKALLFALMATHRAKLPGDVVISEIRPEIKECFYRVGFDRLFRFFDSDAEAVGSF